MYQRVLVPLEGSDGPEAHLRHAAQLAKEEGGQLTLLRVVTVVPANEYVFKRIQVEEGSSGARRKQESETYVARMMDVLTADGVRAKGEVVVREGTPIVASRPHDYPPEYLDSVDVELDEGRFRVPEPGGPVRAIENGPGLVSTETTAEPPVANGELSADPDLDLAKATLLNRRPGGDGRGFTGFVTGFGLERGAVATTRTWELPGLLVVGVDDAAMLRAARRLVEIGGGWTVDDGESVTAEFENEVLGVCSTLPVEASVKRQDAVVSALRDLGCGVEAPLIGLQTLTFPGVPALKLTFSGYADIRKRAVVRLAAE